MSFLTRKVRFNEILTAHRLQKQLVALTQACNASHKSYIGTRDVVGHGFNGNLRYFDAVDMPYPAIRFREETKQISKLREKEKGDWKNLSLEEKKQLYRHNFCLTLAEVDAPTGEWKIHVAVVLFVTSLALYFFGFARKHFYPPLPSTMTPEGKQRTRDLDLIYKTNPIFGVASKFDYEKNQWKK